MYVHVHAELITTAYTNSLTASVSLHTNAICNSLRPVPATARRYINILVNIVHVTYMVYMCYDNRIKSGLVSSDRYEQTNWLLPSTFNNLME